MKYVLTSSDSKLRDTFNSFDFIQSNYDYEYNEVTKKYINKLILPIKTPVVGDYLYFIDNYYNQIPVKVVRLVYAGNTCMIWCEQAELWQIDPFIYAAPNDFHRKYTNDFEDKIRNAYWKMSDKLPKLIQAAKDEYNTNDVNTLSVIVNEIIRYTGVDNTCIDYTNVRYVICELLKSFGDSYAKYWHRPERYEYSDN